MTPTKPKDPSSKEIIAAFSDLNAAIEKDVLSSDKILKKFVASMKKTVSGVSPLTEHGRIQLLKGIFELSAVSTQFIHNAVHKG